MSDAWYSSIPTQLWKAKGHRFITKCTCTIHRVLQIRRTCVRVQYFAVHANAHVDAKRKTQNSYYMYIHVCTQRTMYTYTYMYTLYCSMLHVVIRISKYFMLEIFVYQTFCQISTKFEFFASALVIYNS